METIRSPAHTHTHTALRSKPADQQLFAPFHPLCHRPPFNRINIEFELFMMAQYVNDSSSSREWMMSRLLGLPRPRPRLLSIFVSFNDTSIIMWSLPIYLNGSHVRNRISNRSMIQFVISWRIVCISPLARSIWPYEVWRDDRLYKSIDARLNKLMEHTRARARKTVCHCLFGTVAIKTMDAPAFCAAHRMQLHRH